MSMPSDEQLSLLLASIAPESQVLATKALSLGFTNRSFQIDLRQANGTEASYIVKQFSGNPDLAQSNANLEHEILKFLQSQQILSPEPFFFDANSAIFASPILITKRIIGEQILAHPANPLWAKSVTVIAEHLAKIHQLACSDELIRRLPNATAEATWFLENDEIPDYMQAYPDGLIIWQTVREHLPKMKATKPVFVHGDYWSGNLLWNQAELSAILDWEKAAYGDAAFDVAYCRMELYLEAFDEEADLFLKHYENLMGAELANLPFCELAVAALPMWQHAPYLTISPYQERFHAFVERALKAV